MVKEIITYPTPPSVEYATDVRIFNEDLFSLIEDLKDTINDAIPQVRGQNNCKGLAAYQIGNYFNVVVIKKEDGSFLELINPRIINTNGKITTEETTAYFPGLSAKVERYDNISLVYQDKDASDHSLKASGELSVLLQRKIDYTFGATFLMKLSKDEKELFDKKLEYGSNISIPESCAIVSYKDYILKFANILTTVIAFLLVISFFISENETLSTIWNYQKNISYSILIVSIIYFFYAQYEGKQYSSCTSCQIGNIIGSIAILLIKLTLVMLLSYFLVI
ncbi:MAG: peptide deformylase [Arcobacteraceae bacterium]|nr:peptide deformylase [Arcobacteraceae bacterium]